MKTLLFLVLTHFIADFILQSRKMGQKKSSHIGWLAAHIAIIFVAFLPFGLEFSAWNALTHAIIDATLWNVYKLSVYLRNPYVIKESYDYWNDHWFYTTIGLDQMLHISTLIVLWEMFL